MFALRVMLAAASFLLVFFGLGAVNAGEKIGSGTQVRVGWAMVVAGAIAFAAFIIWPTKNGGSSNPG